MIKKVICINDKQLPPGAEVVEGQTYTVRESYINSFDERVYVLIGVSSPFDKTLDDLKNKKEEVSYALN